MGDGLQNLHAGNIYGEGNFTCFAYVPSSSRRFGTTFMLCLPPCSAFFPWNPKTDVSAGWWWIRPFPGPLFAKLDALSWGCSKAVFSPHLRTQWAKDVLTSTRSRIQMDQQTNVSKTSWNLYCCLDENFMSPEKGIKQHLTSRNDWVGHQGMIKWAPLGITLLSLIGVHRCFVCSWTVFFFSILASTPFTLAEYQRPPDEAISRPFVCQIGCLELGLQQSCL